MAGLYGGAMAIDTPTALSSVSAGPLCEGYSACSVAPYTTHNYQNELSNSYWGMNTGVECTNYVAFVESLDFGVPTPNYALGNATNWASVAESHGVTVNGTPTVGSVAQWNQGDPHINSDGHVAIVEQVGPNDSYIVISQDNWSSDKQGYGWALILNGTPNQGEPWPDNFIHFQTTTLSDTQPARLIQSTGNLYWTANHGISQADVYRASKDNEPGQERILYQAPATSTPVDFEAITYANVEGTYYGYFVANYPSQNESQIMQVPLAGGAAGVLATSPAVIGNRDLVTDGSFL
ncbi:MAG: CHAP domain-containing protein [Solirubrobacteraceae bacterium]